MKRRVVVIGGGFCGTFCAKILSKKLPVDHELILIDNKDCFEYTPSIHKIINDSGYKDKIILKYDKILPNAKIMISDSIKVYKNKIKIKNNELKFDYLVLSTGNKTPIFVENKKNIYALKNIKDALKINEFLPDAKKIAIIGGGLTGVEIAGELATKSLKEVCLIHGANRCVNRLPVRASKLVENFLTKRKVKIYLNELIEKNDGIILYTRSKKKIYYDLAIWAAGIAPDVSYLSNDFKKCIDKQSGINVDENLKVIGFGNVYAGGDINSIPEEKTAQMAKRHGGIIAKNILRSIHNKANEKDKKSNDGALLIRLKRQLIRYTPKKWAWLMSLGDFYCIFGRGRFIYGGVTPAFMKKAIETITILRLKF